MAVLDLSITIADADLPRLITAARAVFGKPDMTQSEMTEYLRQYGINQMQQMVKNYERKVAIAQAEALDPQIEVR